MIVMSLVCSTVFLLAVFAVAQSPSRMPYVLVMGLAAFFVPPFCVFFSPVLGLQVVFVLAATAICARGHAGPSAFRRSMVAATVVAYGFAALMAVREQHDLSTLAAKYRIESMATRLAYEARHQENDGAGSVVQMSHPLSDRWNELSRRQEDTFNLRRTALAQLHSSAVDSFLRSPAFGVGRMTFLANDEWLSRGDDPAVPQSDSLRTDDATPEPDSLVASGEVNSAPPPNASSRPATASDFWQTHAQALADFVSPERFGLIRSRDEVAGFLAHRIGPRANLQMGSALPPPERVELVSLLKFSAPRVYISDNLPRMDELRDGPTRPLDAYEQQALAQLRNGEDIVDTDETGTMRALGAIRALQQCLQCHTVQPAELLGAFSYRWRAARAAPPQELQPRSAT
jgi:hypothetical protein